MVVLAHIKEQSRLSLGSYGRPRMTVTAIVNTNIDQGKGGGQCHDAQFDCRFDQTGCTELRRHGQPARGLGTVGKCKRRNINHTISRWAGATGIM